MRKLAIIGDIHGEYNKLELLFKRVNLSNRKIIIIGDIINRGSNSKSVIDNLILKSKDYEIELLLGNHEISLFSFIENNDFFHFALLGGIATIKSYIKEPIIGDVHNLFLKYFPESHYKLIKSAKLFYEDDNLIISHMGLSPSDVKDRSLQNMVLNSHKSLFDTKINIPKTIIFGHYTQFNFKPFIDENKICLDTGSGYKNGKLSLLLFPEMKIIQT